MDRSPRRLFGFLAALGDPAQVDAPRVGTALLLVALALGLGLRAYLAATTSFPINDGALFYEFVKGVAQAFPALPDFVRYNGIDVPFAYPPLAFWAAALLTRLGADAIDVVRLLPIAMNAGYLLLFAAILPRSGHSRLFTALALLFLVTTLRSFEWLVMGGGLSRGLGSLFLLLTLLAAGVPRTWAEPGAEPSRTRLALAGFCIAGAILSHLEWGVLTTGTFVASRALAGRGLVRFVTEVVFAGVVALLCVLPWVGLVLATHGVEPFLAASGTSNWNLVESVRQIIGLLLNNRVNLFFLLGGVALVARRELFWPVFLLLCLFLTPRHSGTPLVLGIAAISTHGALAFLSLLGRTRLSRLQTAAVTAVLVGLVLAWQVYRDVRWAGPFRPLPAETLQAMNWVRTHHQGARFAVVTEHPWFYDAAAEWFPTLTGATSVTTVQGREWLPDRAFARWDKMDRALKTAEGCPAVLAATRSFGPADFVWAQTRHPCFTAAGYRPIYQSGDIVIYGWPGLRLP